MTPTLSSSQPWERFAGSLLLSLFLLPSPIRWGDKSPWGSRELSAQCLSSSAWFLCLSHLFRRAKSSRVWEEGVKPDPTKHSLQQVELSRLQSSGTGQEEVKNAAPWRYFLSSYSDWPKINWINSVKHGLQCIAQTDGYLYQHGCTTKNEEAREKQVFHQSSWQ